MATTSRGAGASPSEVVERSDPAVISVRGTTGQREGVDALDQHLQGCVWQPAGQGMSRSQVVLGDIQCRTADRGAVATD